MFRVGVGREDRVEHVLNLSLSAIAAEALERNMACDPSDLL